MTGFKEATDSIEWFWTGEHTVGGWVRKIAPAKYLACAFDVEGGHQNISTYRKISDARDAVKRMCGKPPPAFELAAL